MSKTGKYDVDQIRSSLRHFLDTHPEFDLSDFPEDDPVPVLAITEELGEFALGEDDDDGLFEHHRSLPPDERWEKVHQYLAIYYEVKWYVTFLGMCGSRERQDLDVANRNLNALKRVVGSWQFLLCEEKYADEEVKPKYGPERYYEFRWGIKNVPPLPPDAVAYQIGRGVYDCLVRANVPARIAHFELEESSRIVIWRPGPVLGTILFCEDGFRAVSLDFEFPSCTWDHPQFIELLTEVLQKLCKSTVSFADLFTNFDD